MAKYKSIIFMQGENATDAFWIFDTKGRDALLTYLKQFEDDENIVSDETFIGTSDIKIEVLPYIIGINYKFDYVSLSKVVG